MNLFNKIIGKIQKNCTGSRYAPPHCINRFKFWAIWFADRLPHTRLVLSRYVFGARFLCFYVTSTIILVNKENTFFGRGS